MPSRDPSLPEGTDHIIDTNIDLGDSGGATGGGSGGSTSRTDDADAETGSAFKFDQDKDAGAKADSTAAGITGQIKEQISGLKSQATDRVRTLADDGKAQATSVLESIADVLNDAAGSIQEKLGDQYAGPGRNASESIRSLAGRLDDSSIDDLVAGARSLVQKSPAVAIGLAAVVGFAVARVLRSGISEYRTGGQDDAGTQAGGQSDGTGSAARA